MGHAGGSWYHTTSRPSLGSGISWSDMIEYEPGVWAHKSWLPFLGVGAVLFILYMLFWRK